MFNSVYNREGATGQGSTPVGKICMSHSHNGIGAEEYKTYHMGFYEIHAVMKDGKPYTAKELSKLLLMPLQELECILKLMAKLHEVEEDKQALTFYLRVV